MIQKTPLPAWAVLGALLALLLLVAGQQYTWMKTLAVAGGGAVIGLVVGAVVQRWR